MNVLLEFYTLYNCVIIVVILIIITGIRRNCWNFKDFVSKTRKYMGH